MIDKQYLQDVLDVLNFADDMIAMEPYEHSCGEACDLHQTLRTLKLQTSYLLQNDENTN